MSLANPEVSTTERTIRQLDEELFVTLCKIIDARDPFVHGHSMKVAEYAVAIATELGLPAERTEDLRRAALLHDIGKVGVSEEILHKPGRLTGEEYRVVRSHAALGAGFVGTCQGLQHLVPLVRHHHERWDGSGYPDGLRGEQIPLEARILAVADAVEAMASDRPYHRAMSLSEIVAEIVRCTGRQFDPIVGGAFIRVVQLRGDELVINSAREIVRRHSDTGEPAHAGGELLPHSSTRMGQTVSHPAGVAVSRGVRRLLCPG